MESATLLGIRLVGANLESANLRSASMFSSTLEMAHLRDAHLDAADLQQVTLRGASLRNASMRYANLIDASLADANLDGADFCGATCGGTIWTNVSLTKTIGLESITHAGPSSIGLDTVALSAGTIPEIFLRGCGVAAGMLDIQPNLLQRAAPIQFHSCFISYSHKDEAFARRLHGRMQQEDLRVWYAPEEMKAGRKLHEQIDEAIRLHDKLLLVLSEASMASEWVKTEIANARSREQQEGK